MSDTDTRTESPAASTRTDTSPPSGVCLTALSSKFPNACAIRVRSTDTNGISDAASRLNATPFPSAAGRNASTDIPTSSTIDSSWKSNDSAPASACAISPKSSTSRPRCIACWCATSIAAGVGVNTPSRIASRYPRTFVNGVRSSCATSDISLTRCCSALCNLSAIVLKVRPNCPTSSDDETETRSSRFPIPSLPAAPVNARTGERIRRESIVTSSTPPTHAPSPAHTSAQFTDDTTREIAGSATSVSTCTTSSDRNPISSFPVRIGLNLSVPTNTTGCLPNPASESAISRPCASLTTIRRPYRSPALSTIP